MIGISSWYWSQVCAPDTVRRESLTAGPHKEKRQTNKKSWAPRKISAKHFSRKAEGVAWLLLGSESLFLRSGHGQVMMFLWWWWWFSHWVKSDSCGPMDCSLPGSSVHEILQARILEWLAISFSRGPSQPKNQTLVPWTADRFFTDGAKREALMLL